ncbi:hypothetical protein [Breznakiella homolactica]|uniref:Uncharacterized protein n=1 Tax=Breznakiella homolactica TaxID=2798577 RepID=A0A7T7XME1_9SPIR|nr:hypothetical protein [Breznakiella homolactica]QQO09030.1 hypothetical protein JFL75_19195 [Breznakiella homolactica]
MTMVEQDRRRMELSILVAVILWVLLFLVFSLIRIRGPEPPPESLNPVYVELQPIEIPPPPAPVGGTTQAPSTAVTQGPAAVPAAPSAAPRPASPAETSAPSGSGTAAPEQAAQPSLRPDPEAALSPSRSRAPSQFQGGADPFAPLSESALASETPPAPSPNDAAAAQSALLEGRSTAQPSGPAQGQSDSFDRSLSDVADRLASGGGGNGTGSSSAQPSGSGSGTAYAGGTTPGGGDVLGAFDFGDGAARELWSTRRTRIPDRLLTGQPDSLSTAVSFTIEPGGTVLGATIRFDPPLPRDIETHLRAFFASWLFSPADSSGQVRFRYSIKVE